MSAFSPACAAQICGPSVSPSTAPSHHFKQRKGFLICHPWALSWALTTGSPSPKAAVAFWRYLSVTPMLTSKEQMALESAFGKPGVRNNLNLGNCHVQTKWTAFHPDCLLLPCWRQAQRWCLEEGGTPTQAPNKCSSSGCAGAGQCPAQHQGPDICVWMGDEPTGCRRDGVCLYNSRQAKAHLWSISCANKDSLHEVF